MTHPAARILALVVLGARSAVGVAVPDEPRPNASIRAVAEQAEPYIAAGMKAFDLPGLAIGIVAGDRLVYGKGFGVRSKSAGEAVDTHTVFQIGSTTKAFLATTMALMVDRGKFRWDDRVIDLD